jgi:hypothetical protein
MRGAYPWNPSRGEQKRVQKFAKLREDIEAEEKKLKQFHIWSKIGNAQEQMRRLARLSEVQSEGKSAPVCDQ